MSTKTVQVNLDIDYLNQQVTLLTKALTQKDDAILKIVLKNYKFLVLIATRLSNGIDSVALVPALRAKLNDLSGEFLEAVEADMESGRINEGRYLVLAEVAKVNHEQATVCLDVLELGLAIKCKTFNS
jgi:hypothetical protein